MVEKSCRCGASKKRFHMDIGPFFMGECCEAAGFDVNGNLAGGGGTVTPSGNFKPHTFLPSGTFQIAGPTPTSVKPGRGKLRDMRVDDLKKMAKEAGIEGTDEMTKNQLIEAIRK